MLYGRFKLSIEEAVFKGVSRLKPPDRLKPKFAQVMIILTSGEGTKLGVIASVVSSAHAIWWTLIAAHTCEFKIFASGRSQLKRPLKIPTFELQMEEAHIVLKKKPVNMRLHVSYNQSATIASFIMSFMRWVGIPRIKVNYYHFFRNTLDQACTSVW